MCTLYLGQEMVARTILYIISYVQVPVLVMASWLIYQEGLVSGIQQVTRNFYKPFYKED